MANEILDRAAAAEEKADKIMEGAKKESFLKIQEARRKAEEILREAERNGAAKAEKLVAEAEAEAENEKKAIEKRLLSEIDLLIKNSYPKLNEAKRSWQ